MPSPDGERAPGMLPPAFPLDRSDRPPVLDEDDPGDMPGEDGEEPSDGAPGVDEPAVEVPVAGLVPEPVDEPLLAADLLPVPGAAFSNEATWSSWRLQI